MNLLAFIQKPDEEILINFYTLINVNMTEINIMIQVTREVISYSFSSFDPHLILSWPNEWIKRMEFIFPGSFFFTALKYEVSFKNRNWQFANQSAIYKARPRRWTTENKSSDNRVEGLNPGTNTQDSMSVYNYSLLYIINLLKEILRKY